VNVNKLVDKLIQESVDETVQLLSCFSGSELGNMTTKLAIPVPVPKQYPTNLNVNSAPNITTEKTVDDQTAAMMAGAPIDISISDIKTFSEYSVENCLKLFSAPEVLTGGNAVICEECSRVFREKLFGATPSSDTTNISYKSEAAGSDDEDDGGTDFKVEKINSEPSDTLIDGLTTTDNVETSSNNDQTKIDTDDNSSSSESTKGKKKSKDKTVKNKNSTEKKAPKLKMVKTTSTKRFLVHRAPQVLTIHIKRFMQTFRGIQKNEKHVRFSEFLDLTPFCHSRDFEMYVKNGLIGPAPTVNPILYRLYGVVEHLGGMGGGHYVAYVRKNK